MKAKALILLLVRLALCLFGMFAAPYLITWVYINDISPDIHDQSIRAETIILCGMVVGLGSFLALVGGFVLKEPHTNLRIILALVVGFVYMPSLFCFLVYWLLKYIVPDL